MSEKPQPASALIEVPAAREPGLTIQEEPPHGLLNLRGQTGQDSFLEAVRGATGITLPVDPNTVATSEKRRALWLAPTEWLLLVEPEQTRRVEEKMQQALAGVFAGVTDVSGYYTALAISGRDARALLSRGCPLDLHPRAFKPGRCAQSLFAKATVTLELVDQSAAETPRFRLIVRRSFADYVWRWLHAAMTALENGASPE